MSRDPMNTCRRHNRTNMKKFMIVALVQMAVLFVMQVSAESCNDDFIKEMIVNICGMGGMKRSFPDNSRTGSSLGQNFKGVLTDVEREFKHLVGDIEEVDLLLKTSNVNKPKGIDEKMAANKKLGIMQMFRECCVNKNCSLSDLNRICEKK